jgi:hypothetical protein
MSAGKCLTEAEALEALRGVIVDLPVSRRSTSIICDEMRARGVNIGWRRVRELIQRHDLLDLPDNGVARIVHLADHPARKAVKAARKADSLETLEEVAQGLLSLALEAIPHIRIENANQLATVAGAGGSLVKVVVATRETLAKLEEGKTTDGSVAGSNRFTTEDVFAIYGAGGEGWKI